MAEQLYDLGDVATLSVSFTVLGVATDPTTVTGSVTSPDGVTTNYIVAGGQIIKDSVGHYHIDIVVTQTGWWTFKLVGTGVATDTGQGSFYVRSDSTATTSLYVLRDELKNTLELGSETYADADLDLACSAASRVIDGYKQTRYYPTTETRVYTPRMTWTNIYGYSRGVCEVIIDDLNTLTTLKVDLDGDGVFETTWTNGTHFFLEPTNAAADRVPFNKVVLRDRSGAYFPTWQHSIQIAGSFGWASTPDAVRAAALILAARLLKRARETPYGLLVVAGDAVVAARLGKIDPDVAAALDNQYAVLRQPWA